MINSVLLEDIPRHDTRFFEVREAFEHALSLGFRAYIRAYLVYRKNKNAAGVTHAAAGTPGGPSREALRGPSRSPPGGPAGVLCACGAQHALHRLLRPQ